MIKDQKVSVITPVYNCADVLEETIESVRSQTFQNWELILVDDCSTDDSWEVVTKFIEIDNRIKGVKMRVNSGAAKSRNKGIEEATGRFIAFLDSDDLWLPEKLELQVQFSLSNNAALTHSSYEVIDAEGNRSGRKIKAKPILSYSDMLDYNFIGCLTAMYDVEVIGQKVYMPNILKRQDYALWLKIMRSGFRAYGLDKELALYRTGRKSLSSNKFKAAMYNLKLLVEIEGLSKPKALYHFVRYLILAVRKYFFSKQ